MKKKIPLILIMILTISSCGPTREQINNADYGAYPENYKEIIEAYNAWTFVDPYSIHYRWESEPYKGYGGHLHRYAFGYVVRVGINAKNRMGGYVGEILYWYLIKNGVVIINGRMK